MKKSKKRKETYSTSSSKGSLIPAQMVKINCTSTPEEHNEQWGKGSSQQNMSQKLLQERLKSARITDIKEEERL